MKDTTPQMHHDSPQYMHGQFLALRAILLALVKLTTDRELFRQEAKAHLELLKTALLPESVAEQQIVAIDEMSEFLDYLSGDSLPSS